MVCQHPLHLKRMPGFHPIRRFGHAIDRAAAPPWSAFKVTYQPTARVRRSNGMGAQAPAAVRAAVTGHARRGDPNGDLPEGDNAALGREAARRGVTLVVASGRVRSRPAVRAADFCRIVTQDVTPAGLRVVDLSHN